MRFSEDIHCRYRELSKEHLAQDLNFLYLGSLPEEPYALTMHVRVSEGPGWETAPVYSEGFKISDMLVHLPFF
jgi:hypothetical protein